MKKVTSWSAVVIATYLWAGLVNVAGRDMSAKMIALNPPGLHLNAGLAANQIIIWLGSMIPIFGVIIWASLRSTRRVKVE